MKGFRLGLVRSMASIVVASLLLSACGGAGKGATPASGGGGSPSSAPAGEPIMIGGLAPLTGAGSSLGLGIRDGGNLAVKLVNAKGGVLGRPLKLQIEDDQGDPAKGSAAARKLIERDGAFALYGGGSSSSTIPATDFAQQNKVPFIVTTATADQIATPARRYIFRTQVNSAAESYALTKMVLDRYKPKTMAIMALANDYGKSSADGILANLKKLNANVTVVLNEPLPAGGTDFSSQLLRLKQANPDVALVVMLGELVPFLRQAKQMGIKTPLPQFSGILLRGPVESLGNDLTDLVSFYYAKEPISTNAKDPRMAEFVREFYKEYNKYPTTNDMQGYQGIMVLVKAIEKAGAVDREKFVDALESFDSLDLGLFLPLSFSKTNHEGAKSGTLIEFLPGRKVDGTIYGNVKIWSPN